MTLHRSREAVGEVNQTLAALSVIITCVGLVIAAVHSASSVSEERAHDERARAQAEVWLDAIARDPNLAWRAGVLSGPSAYSISAGFENLSSVPPGLRFVSLLNVFGGDELWLIGSLEDVNGSLVVERPVGVALGNGSIVPALLRVGVDRA